jgi:hypothetical protein
VADVACCEHQLSSFTHAALELAYSGAASLIIATVTIFEPALYSCILSHLKAASRTGVLGVLSSACMRCIQVCS